jgi:SEC-C motif
VVQQCLPKLQNKREWISTLVYCRPVLFLMTTVLEEQSVARKKVSRNAPCPCGSGKKYKKCCWGKGFDWEEDEGGDLYRSTPISPEVAEVLEQQRQQFIEKFGREPGPDDPVFSDLPHPEHLEAMMVEDMTKAGIDPAIIYAFEKTGRLVTEENQHLLPAKALDEWQAAIEEYEERHGNL